MSDRECWAFKEIIKAFDDSEKYRDEINFDRLQRRQSDIIRHNERLLRMAGSMDSPPEFLCLDCGKVDCHCQEEN